MRIDNLIYLIDGELKNSPSITSINGFSFDALNIKRGDLFFAKDKKDIDIAIRNGAYGIVFDDWIQISDFEIAWIKVKNLEIAALKLLRFFIIEKNIPIFKITSLEFDIAKSISNEKEILFLEDSFLKAFIDFLNYDKKVILLKDEEILKRLSLDSITPNIKKPIKLLKSYIFETSFIYNDTFYERVLIPSIFIKDFNIVLDIFLENSLEYNIKNIEKLNHFKPYFIDNHFSIKDFGKSDKVIILENDYNLLNFERLFLEKKAKWAKKIYISDKKIDGFLYEKRFDKIKEILYNSYFNFALIAKKDFLIENLEIKKEYKTLF